MTASVFDDRICTLGEGPLWHPERRQLFWFDILGKRLLSQRDGHAQEWKFHEHVSAAGWVDHDTLLIASESAFYKFDIPSGERTLLHRLEDDKRANRSNDGRADPHGGFWIGTMGKNAEPGAGAIYRLYKGEIRKLFDDISISNAICFAPDGRTAYFADTEEGWIKRQPLNAQGWPDGAAAMFLDLKAEGLNPDGAVVDAEGYLWNAQWGAGRVARYSPAGVLDQVVDVPGLHSSCPAFGGQGLKTLFVTTARIGVPDPDDGQGKTYCAVTDVAGQSEARVIL